MTVSQGAREKQGDVAQREPMDLDLVAESWRGVLNSRRGGKIWTNDSKSYDLRVSVQLVDSIESVRLGRVRARGTVRLGFGL